MRSFMSILAASGIYTDLCISSLDSGGAFHSSYTDLCNQADLERDGIEPPSRSRLLFEHDLRANASRLSRGKTATHFSGSCSSGRRREGEKQPCPFSRCSGPCCRS